ncbi:MAG TPA: hypothetical protein VK440_03515 [Burkholderiales bacterium]|nr:hypothetical protein [Burkholderiales bacterium]
MNYRKSLVFVLATVCFVFMASLAQADQYGDYVEPSGEAMAGDLLLVRPVSLGATIVGFCTWIIALPFTIPSGSVASSAKALIGDPAQYTFLRPLGQSEAKPIPYDVER